MFGVYLSAITLHPELPILDNQPNPRAVMAIRWLHMRQLFTGYLGQRGQLGDREAEWLALHELPHAGVFEYHALPNSQRPRVIVCGRREEYALHADRGGVILINQSAEALESTWNAMVELLINLPLDYRIRQDPFLGRGAKKSR